MGTATGFAKTTAASDTPSVENLAPSMATDTDHHLSRRSEFQPGRDCTRSIHIRIIDDHPSRTGRGSDLAGGEVFLGRRVEKTPVREVRPRRAEAEGGEGRQADGRAGQGENFRESELAGQIGARSSDARDIAPAGLTTSFRLGHGVS